MASNNPSDPDSNEKSSEEIPFRPAFFRLINKPKNPIQKPSVPNQYQLDKIAALARRAEAEALKAKELESSKINEEKNESSQEEEVPNITKSPFGAVFRLISPSKPKAPAEPVPNRYQQDKELAMKRRLLGTKDEEIKDETVEEGEKEEFIPAVPAKFRLVTKEDIEKKKSSSVPVPNDSPEVKKEEEEPKEVTETGEEPLTVPFYPEPPKLKKYIRVNTRYVARPCKTIGGDTPIRPFPENLYWYNPRVSGSAADIMDRMFPQGTKEKPGYSPWSDANFSAHILPFQKIEEKRQEALRCYTGTTEEQRNRMKQKVILNDLQEILWLTHFYKTDEFLEKTIRLMIQKCIFRIDENRRLRFIGKDDLSLVWNSNFTTENSSILSQRDPEWSLRPVYIDGLSLMDTLSPATKGLPVFPTRVMLEVLTHFILDGHETLLYLPDVYQSNEYVDDPIVFQLLSDLGLMKFVSGRSRKTVEQQIVKEAEKCHGILVSASKELKLSFSIQSFPVFQMYSATKNDDFSFSSFFERSESSDEETYQQFSEKCRLYSNEEKMEIDTFSLQLTLKRQVSLISHFLHVAKFHCQRHRQIQILLIITNRFVSELIPPFMRKTKIMEVGTAIGTLQSGHNLTVWPLF